MMRLLDLFLYQIRPYGIEADQRPTTPEPPPDLNLVATPWFIPNETTVTTTSSTRSTTTYTASTIAMDVKGASSSFKPIELHVTVSLNPLTTSTTTNASTRTASVTTTNRTAIS